MQKMHGRNLLEKIVVNTGIGRLATNSPNFEEKVLPHVVEEFKTITGQYPAVRRARISVAGFKVREGTVVGLSATLRGARMRDFLDHLNVIVLPRVRDFRGIQLKNIDGNGNISIGLREHTAFPEISPEISKHDFGLQVTIVPKIKNRKNAEELYRLLGVPLLVSNPKATDFRPWMKGESASWRIKNRGSAEPTLLQPPSPDAPSFRAGRGFTKRKAKS